MYTKRSQQFEKFVKPYCENMEIKDIIHPLISTILENKAKTSIETVYRLYNYINQIYQYT